MEVTQSNFNSVLCKIEQALKNCTFLSIDCELTGLNTSTNINAFDTPKQYYEKVQRSCRDFLVIQYGLSLFCYDMEKNVFKQQSYNFYIFRRPVDRNVPDQRFLCQSSSIDFLVNQGFDFNKLFKEGIPYLNVVEENRCKENVEEDYKRSISNVQNLQQKDSIAVPENIQPFVDSVMEQIKQFIESNLKEFQLPKCKAFVRRLIYQTHSEKFSELVSLETRQIKSEKCLYVTRLKTIGEQQQIEKQKYEEKLDGINNFLGFTKVLQLVVSSGKLVIGHNLCLDLLHTIDKFLTPLPDDYEEFKQCAHSLFPKVLDTKYMSSSEPFKDLIVSNVLKCLLEAVSKRPFVMPVVEIEQGAEGYNVDDCKEHEAGYDAYITGLCFLAMWTYLGESSNLTNDNPYVNLDLLHPYINRIFLMKLTDNQFLNLDGLDVVPSRDHVFYVTFPNDWKTANIVKLFKPFGYVYISWIDDTSAYVALHKRDQVKLVLNSLSQSSVYTICTFDKKKLVDLKKKCSNSFDRKTLSGGETRTTQRKKRKNNVGIGSMRSLSSINSVGGAKIAKTFLENQAWDD